MRLLGLSTLVLLGATSAFASDKVVQAPACCGVTHTSVKCGCASGSAKCSCESCSRDENCGCVVALKKGKGVITGRVKSRYTKRYPTVVYIEETPGLRFAPPARPAALDQKGKVFKPRVLPVLVGTTVDFFNNDDFEHNVFSPDGEKYNLGKWTKGQVRSYTFKRPGAYVQLCSIHPEMVGYVVVVKTPYFAVAKKDGTFTIPNVPPGNWKLKVWNERFRKKSLNKEFPIKVTKGQSTAMELKP